jgi:hypothetical protein
MAIENVGGGGDEFRYAVSSERAYGAVGTRRQIAQR